jgi:hypothetical protein
MAGAGYKLFNTGDVLTAAQVNTYLMEQSVMVFADAAARTTALTGVVAEGMLSYLKDTNAVEVYDGSNWVASDDPNAIQNTIVDAKGDLITATAADTPARLAVGNSGETLVANSAAATGLSYKEDYAAGKNKIINGDFRINQRGFTSNTSGGDVFEFDRWQSQSATTGTVTRTAEVFTLGAAPVAGYEGTNFYRYDVAGQSGATARAQAAQIIESVRTFAGETVTVSFWAKAASGTPGIAVAFQQYFGTGGSPSSIVTTAGGKNTISTSWARYSYTVAVPSISGKTIGTNNNNGLLLQIWFSGGSNFDARTTSLGVQNNTFDIWGVQVEAGSVATAFQTATGTLQGELAACQRYFCTSYSQGTTAGTATNVGSYSIITATAGTGAMFISVRWPVVMRTSPTTTVYDSLGASGKVYKGANGKTVAIQNQGDSGARIGTTDATSADELTFQFIANAEL